LYVHDSDKVSLDGIKVKHQVKYLEIDICKSGSERLHKNFQPRIDKTKK